MAQPQAVTGVGVGASSSVMASVEMPEEDWKVDTFDCCATGAGNCLYACLCGTCAQASARSKMDDSNWCFNCLCLTPCASRNIIREGYHIKGNCVMDILCAGCCLPCSNCQVLSEAETRGNASTQWGANRSATEIPWQVGMCDCFRDCGVCCCSALVPGCVIAMARSNFDGSNCCFNALCVGPCLNRSIIRDGYNLEGSCMADMCLPVFCGPCVACQAYNEVTARGSAHKTFVQVQVPAPQSMGR